MKWISVKDKLPEISKTDTYDIIQGFSDKVIVLEKGVSYFGKYNLNENFWSVFGRSGGIEVTHWIPLPENTNV